MCPCLRLGFGLGRVSAFPVAVQPAPMGPEPLLRITPDEALQFVAVELRQALHILFAVACGGEINGLLHEEFEVHVIIQTNQCAHKDGALGAY